MDPTVMAALELQPTSGVVITGGASGIGLATAHRSRRGRPRRGDLGPPPERATEAAEAVAAAHGVKAVGKAVDVRDTDTLGDAADEAVAAIGTIGGLVHAAASPVPVRSPRPHRQDLGCGLRSETCAPTRW